MDDLINDFIAETRDMLQALSGALVAWEAAPDDKARLDEIFRFVHTVKGNCGFFDLPRLEQLSHAAEDALAEVRAGRRAPDPKLVSAVLAVLDRIGELVQALESGEALACDDDDQLISALSAEGEPSAGSPLASTAGPLQPPEPKRGLRSIRLSVDLLDRIMNGVSDAVLARNELARRLRDCPGDVAVEAAFERVSACIGEIRDAITRTRMQRLDSLFSALPRMVRDLSAELGKQVRLEVDGGDVELDREMIEMIRDPMTHILRNAVDHGIEAPKERAKAGKPSTGTVRVSARQSGNQILIEVSDDGRGIDGEQLARKAIAAGALGAERADRLSAAQKAALVFEPGLTTARKVTAISGRGVGMDVVRANIERIGGLVDLDSRPGQGVRLTLRVPLTLTIIPALTVSAAGQTFAIPRSAIEEILRTGGASVAIEVLGDAAVASIRGSRLPLVSLSRLLRGGGESEIASGTIVRLKPAGGGAYALLVDSVHDHEELVVKPAAPAIMAGGIYAGTTLADDGRPVLLLDPSGIAAEAGIEAAESVAEPAPNEGESAAERLPLVLFDTLDGARRAVRLSVVERIEDVPADAVSFGAGRLRVAIDDRIVPLAGGAAPPEDGKLRILRLTDGSAELAYAFSGAADILSVSAELRPAPAPGEIAGVMLIEGAQVELLDPYWLFAAHSDAAPAGAGGPVCALPEGDPWMDNMLRPLIESLGYRIAAPGDSCADLVILGEEPEDVSIPEGASIVRLRSSPDEAGREGSIYRYDRAALLGALSRGGGKGVSNG